MARKVAKDNDGRHVRRERPKSATPKKATNLRLEPDVLDHYRATGAGWQSRINQALRKAAGLGSAWREVRTAAD